MATTAVLDGLALTTGSYTLSEGIDWGTDGVASTLLQGDLRPEEYDQALAEVNYVRQVTVPFNIRSGTFAQSVTDLQAVMQKLSAANRYQTLNFVFTPNGGTASTFKVIGGSVQTQTMNQQVDGGVVRQAVLVLNCLPFIYGPAQSGGALGSSGSPIATNQPTPLNVTVTPSPTGDVPADVTLFVKNKAVLATTVQTITINASGGSFVLNFGQVTICNAVLWNMTQSSLQSFFTAALGTGGGVVSGSTGGPFTITFGSAYALNQQLLTVGTNSLTGGSHSVAIAATGTTGIPIRGLMVATISGNTSWTPQVANSAWTLDVPADPTVASVSGVPPDPATFITANGVYNQDTIYPVAHWTQPTLPTDRRFQVWLRARDARTANRGVLQFRLRHLTGSNQVVGAWRSLPVEASANVFAGVKMGSWPFPLSPISAGGAASTVTYLEARSLSTDNSLNGLDFDYAYYQPEDSTITFETEDTSTTLAANGDVLRLETDELFVNSTHAAAGMVAVGPHVRSIGTSRYTILTSQGFIATIDPSYGWGDGENVDVWATVTPRYIGLAA